MPDQFFDGQAAADRAQVPREDVLDARVHLILLIEKATRGVGDRDEVVADLVDDDRFDVDRNALLRDAVDHELGLVEIEREFAHHLHARNHERAVTRHDLEAHAFADARARRRTVLPKTRQDQRYVRFGDAPHRAKENEDERARDDDRYDDRDRKRAETRSYHETDSSTVSRRRPSAADSVRPRRSARRAR